MDLTKFGVEASSKNEVKDENLDFSIEEMRDTYNFTHEERFLPWFMKYQLNSFDDLIETQELKKVREFFDSPKKDKGLLLIGSPGSGKTTTLHLFGEAYNYEIFEMNASDTRNKSSITELVKGVISQQSLFNQQKLLLIDEVDGVSGTKDRGGVAEIIKLMRQSKYPFVFTANDFEANALKSLKKQCVVVDFESHSYELLHKLAKKILDNEGISYTNDNLDEFTKKRVTSDIRGFINDLQASVFSGTLVSSDLDDLEIRNYKQKIDMVLNSIFYSTPLQALFSTRNSDVDLDDLLLYLEENIPTVLDKKFQYRSFNELSKADVFKGRIRTWQYWRYLVYINFYLTYGVNCFSYNSKSVSFKRNQRILKKWIYGNKMNPLRVSTKAEKQKGSAPRFVEELAKDMNTSAEKCRSRDIPYIAYMVKNNSFFSSFLSKHYSLDTATIKALEEFK